MVRVTTVQPSVRSKPVDLRQRRDLMKIVEKGGADGRRWAGKRPHYLTSVPCDAAARRQYSFSRLTGTIHAETAGSTPARWRATPRARRRLDPRSLGTLVSCGFGGDRFRPAGRRAERVRRLAEQHLSGDDRQREEALAVEMIERFAASPRAAQLAGARESFRELEFLAGLAARVFVGPTFLSARSTAPQEADKNVCPTEASNLRYLQGFIDCLYRERRWLAADRLQEPTGRRPRRWQRRRRPTKCRCSSTAWRPNDSEVPAGGV